MVGIATDVGHASSGVVKAFAGCQLLFFEFNHDADMLRIGPYPTYLKARVAGPGGHLSNDEAAEALPRLLASETNRLVAVHLSRTNNRAEIVEESLAHEIGRLGATIEAAISRHDRPTPLYFVHPGLAPRIPAEPAVPVRTRRKLEREGAVIE